jgi:F-type H+-transporting ATPase subunit b
MLGCAAAAMWAQEGHAAAEHAAGDPLLVNKIVNFGILAAGLGFLVLKFGVPALKAQQKEILAGLNRAAERAEAAQLKAKEADAHLAGLETAVAAIRTKAEAELKAEVARLEKETAQQMEKVEQTAGLEIESARKHAIEQVRTETARLALELASTRIAAQMTPEAQAALVARFIGTLDQQASRDRV